jgi:hypothetical protein
MRESERVEILHNLLTEHGFLLILGLVPVTDVSAATEAA